ncbi:MAG TPA: hypothetical protein VN966_00115 [Candidatus Bathyarchaeia archaeon]|nr:hypothetical protein [Candidatus Bathyarchaeia archaeon]
MRDDVLKELEALIEEGKRIVASFKLEEWGNSSSMLDEVEVQAFATLAVSAIERIAGQDTNFYKHLPKKPNRLTFTGPGENYIPSITGSLIALRRAVDGGLLVRLETHIRANVYDDFLVQADELLTANYHVAAMVLISGVLEEHLSKLCVAQNLTWSGSGSLAKYNDILRDKLYDQVTWRRIQAIADSRNDAAHGKGALVKPEDVIDAHRYASRFVADFPA